MDRYHFGYLKLKKYLSNFNKYSISCFLCVDENKLNTILEVIQK